MKLGCLQSINQDLDHLHTILSPSGKKNREDSNSKTIGEVNEEVFKAPTMAEDMGKKMDLILTKPQYLDNIESRLNDFLTTVSSIEGKIAHLDHDVQVLQEKVK